MRPPDLHTQELRTFLADVEEELKVSLTEARYLEGSATVCMVLMFSGALTIILLAPLKLGIPHDVAIAGCALTATFVVGFLLFAWVSGMQHSHVMELLDMKKQALELILEDNRKRARDA